MRPDQTPLNAPELVEKLRRILAKPLPEDEDKTTKPYTGPLRSGAASPSDTHTDPMEAAIRRKLGGMERVRR